MSDVTRILAQIDSGDPKAAEQLLPLVYNQLRRLAAARLAREKPGQTLQATALVHEAWLQLVKISRDGTVRSNEGSQWSGRGHFFGAAAEAMRRILVQVARRRNAQKRGGGWEQIELDPALLPAGERSDKLLALDEALSQFESQHPEKASLVKLRFFAGMTNQEAAEVLGISSATADRHWAYARAWIQRAMTAASA
jgi:RNA polymerase sigma factor (TIGR02999 family)